MPDLSRASVDAYWADKGENMLLTLGQMASEEPWSKAAAGTIGEAARLLGSLFENAPEGQLATIADDPETVDHVRFALAYCDPATRLRLLSWLAEERGPDGEQLAGRVLAPAGSQPKAVDAANVVRESLRHLARLDLMYKVFAPERLALIHEAIKRG